VRPQAGTRKRCPAEPRNGARPNPETTLEKHNATTSPRQTTMTFQIRHHRTCSPLAVTVARQAKSTLCVVFVSQGRGSVHRPLCAFLRSFACFAFSCRFADSVPNGCGSCCFWPRKTQNTQNTQMGQCDSGTLRYGEQITGDASLTPTDRMPHPWRDRQHSRRHRGKSCFPSSTARPGYIAHRRQFHRV